VLIEVPALLMMVWIVNRAKGRSETSRVDTRFVGNLRARANANVDIQAA
jgi:hypothetical protein